MTILIKGEALKLKGKEAKKKLKEEPKPDVNLTTDDDDKEDLNDKFNNIMEGLRFSTKDKVRLLDWPPRALRNSRYRT